jgi:thiosulfate reductase/polysulfide reductase chain A
MIGKLDDWDKAGGGVNLCEAFVYVKKSIRNNKGRAEL